MIRFNRSLRMATKAGLLMLPLLLTQAVSSTNAANSIGKIHSLRMFAYGTLPGETKKAVYQNDPVFSGQTMETVEKGAMTVLFSDGTEFRLGPAARMTLDKYVYDPAGKANALNINMVSGMFRFTTGKINKEAVQLKTPVATIGIRGTDFGVSVEKSGDTIVQVFSGQVAIGTKSGEQLVNPGEYITVEAKGVAAVQKVPYFFAPPGVGPSANVVARESDDRGGDGGDNGATEAAASAPADDDDEPANPGPGPGDPQVP
jgi:ferric-dicitrate binding protein FerR (iron transport regulator)